MSLLLIHLGFFFFYSSIINIILTLFCLMCIECFCTLQGGLESWRHLKLMDLVITYLTNLDRHLLYEVLFSSLTSYGPKELGCLTFDVFLTAPRFQEKRNKQRSKPIWVTQEQANNTKRNYTDKSLNKERDDSEWSILISKDQPSPICTRVLFFSGTP